MILDDMQTMFLEEADEQLAQVESALLELSDTETPEAVNKCFRIFHSIKGGASMTGLTEVAHFTHHVETVLDRVRDGQLEVTNDLVALVLASKDHIESLLSSARGGAFPAPSVEQALLARLTVVAPVKDWLGEKKREVAAAKAAEPSRPIALSVTFAVRDGQSITAASVASLLADLHEQGTCTVAIDTTGIPSLDGLSPSECRFVWQVELETTSSADSIRDLFIFVEDALELGILETVSAGGNLVFESSDGGFAEIFGPPSAPPASVTATEPSTDPVAERSSRAERATESTSGHGSAPALTTTDKDVRV